MSEFYPNGCIIAVTGNLGVGKTTFCTHLKCRIVQMYDITADRVVVIAEPAFDDGRLEEFYSDKERYAASFQRYMEDRRYKIMKEAHVKKSAGYIVIVDQSLLFDIVFARANKVYFTDEQWAAYKTTYTRHLAEFDAVDAVVYIRALPGVCKRRVTDRDRHEERDRPITDDGVDSAEESIPLSYLSTLHGLYDGRFAKIRMNPRLAIASLCFDWGVFPTQKELDDKITTIFSQEEGSDFSDVPLLVMTS